MELQKVQRTTLTMKEAAEYLGISYWLINQLVRQKQIPCSKVGGISGSGDSAAPSFESEGASVFLVGFSSSEIILVRLYFFAILSGVSPLLFTNCESS